MKHVRKLITPQSLISIIATVIFGITLRVLYFKTFGLIVSLDQIDLTNLSFLTIVAAFKQLIFFIFKDYFFQALPMGSSSNILHEKFNILFMEDKSVQSDTEQKDYSDIKSPLERIDHIDLKFRTMRDSLYILQDLKLFADIRIIELPDGQLAMDFPRNMPTKDITKIRNRVLELDLSINQQAETLKNIMEKDKELGGQHSKCIASHNNLVSRIRAEVYDK